MILEKAQSKEEYEAYEADPIINYITLQGKKIVYYSICFKKSI